jgi:hypothetical protein
MKTFIIKILGFLFPYKELDSRPDYTFTNEKLMEGITRKNQLVDWTTTKF